jgi:hypothetical protein
MLLPEFLTPTPDTPSLSVAPMKWSNNGAALFSAVNPMNTTDYGVEKLYFRRFITIYISGFPCAAANSDCRFSGYTLTTPTSFI